MRFIIREQDYETPLAAGKFRYEIRGEITGMTESWRLTQISAGYSFLRVDLDAREAQGGESILFHMVLGPGRRPERLKFRHFGVDVEIIGDVLFSEHSISLNRAINGNRFEESENLLEGFGFWFPSAVGFALLAGPYQKDVDVQAITLNLEQGFALTSWKVKVEQAGKEILAVTGQEVAVRQSLIRWGDQSRCLWLDDHNWPVLVEYGDGIRAIETQYIRY